MKLWQTIRLDEVCEVRLGRTPQRDKPEYWGGNAIWVTIRELSGDVITDSREHISELAVREVMPTPVPTGTLLFSFKLTIGKMGVSGCPLYTNEAIAALIIRDDKKLSGDFLRYALMASSHDSGANIAVLGKVLNKEKVSAIEIPLPPLPEQERIVGLLDEADALCRLRKQAEARMAAFIPALFHEMFGDPATNEKGWFLISIGELLTILPNYGTMIPGTSKKENWLNLRVANIINNELDLSDKKFVNLPEEMIERHSVQDGDLLLARAIGSREQLGKCFVAHPTGQNWAFDSHLMRLRLDDTKMIPEFLHAFLTSPSGRNIFMDNSRQSAVQFNINAGEVSRIKIPMPPLILQREFAARVSEARALQAAQAASTERVEALFQSMLARAFAGEL